jgi:hypothetical protein
VGILPTCICQARGLELWIALFVTLRGGFARFNSIRSRRTYIRARWRQQHRIAATFLKKKIHRSHTRDPTQLNHYTWWPITYVRMVSTCTVKYSGCDSAKPIAKHLVAAGLFSLTPRATFYCNLIIGKRDCNHHLTWKHRRRHKGESPGNAGFPNAWTSRFSRSVCCSGTENNVAPVLEATSSSCTCTTCLLRWTNFAYINKKKDASRNQLLLAIFGFGSKL